MFKLVNKIRENYKLRVFEVNLLEDCFESIGISNYSKNKKIAYFIVLPIVIVAVIIVFVFKFPLRIVADFKNVTRDIMKNMGG